MNSVQRMVLVVFLSATLLILVLDRLFPGASPVNLLKYATIIGLFLVASAVRKRHREQLLMNRALFWVVVADFFLVFCQTIPGVAGKTVPFGVAGFLLAYLNLIAAYQRNFQFGRGELGALVLVLGIAVPVAARLIPYTSGLILAGGCLFWVVLCYLAWTAISTIFRGYFSLRASFLIALSGLLMLASDLVMAVAGLTPGLAGQFVPGLKNLIWATYIPAWTLVVVVIAETRLLSGRI